MVKFLCDQMLGTLATWLRILGYDTYYPPQNSTDDEILQIAKTEQRTIISRDKELLIRAKKENISIMTITSTILNEQLQTVMKHVSFDKSQLLSRCTICNTPLQTIEKNLIKDQVPKRVFEKNTTFWYCPTCNKVYWLGTHYDNMTKKLDQISKQQ